MRQLGFLPAGLGANLAVRREAFESVGGFAEELLIGEDIDLCWRLQLEGYRFVIEFGAVVAKRERPGFQEVFRQAAAYGRSGPALYRRHRRTGAKRNLGGAAKSWLWLVVLSPAWPGRGASGSSGPGRRGCAPGDLPARFGSGSSSPEPLGRPAPAGATGGGHRDDLS